jgi:hypothetical protein
MSRYRWLRVTFISRPSVLLLNAEVWTMILFFIQVNSAHIQSNEGISIPSVAKFFPQIQSDLSRVKWGHGVNSKVQLTQSLQGEYSLLLGYYTQEIKLGNQIKIFLHQVKITKSNFVVQFDKGKPNKNNRSNYF